ncbi:unnamed protein product [Phytomonas sp. Hart1]|nr:unnamed protein product [Phytomonas sp. Hart1]|eukprot:CCW66581.1 unnamed protein product [Phytomonas sp. isolate Hart1]
MHPQGDREVVQGGNKQHPIPVLRRHHALLRDREGLLDLAHTQQQRGEVHHRRAGGPAADPRLDVPGLLQAVQGLVDFALPPALAAHVVERDGVEEQPTLLVKSPLRGGPRGVRGLRGGRWRSRGEESLSTQRTAASEARKARQMSSWLRSSSFWRSASMASSLHFITSSRDMAGRWWG